MANSPLRAPLAALAVFAAVCAADVAAAQEQAILAPGDAVVTGFSGVIEPPQEEPPLTAAQILDETLINPDGVTARINALSSPSYVWDARVWPADLVQDFKAKDVGQVFGVTIDDAEHPNIYVTATSAYGLHVVAPDADADGRPERLKKGRADALWMDGMWGAVDAKDPAGSVGGPGSIWKVDGKTAEVSLFANVMLNNEPNAGAGLGNITYVPALKQLFVSDLSTGKIHRFAMDGAEVETFDHGTTGRASANLAPVPYDAAGRLDITSKDFDSEDPETWGYADADRRVWGLAYHDGRLYYAVVGGSQIWSVGFDKDTGKFLPAAQWELDVPKKPKNLPVSDIIFSHKGAMILAQRGEITSTYDYADFANAGKSRLYRYWLENPDDPNTPSRWIEQPEEYAVGFDEENRGTNGGIDLNYNYTKEGYLDTTICEASLWSTGDNLRRTEVEDLKKALLPGGTLVIDGLQGMPAGPVKDNNTPPWASYMVDNDTANTDIIDGAGAPLPYADVTTEGWIGDVAIYHPCGSGGVADGGGGSWWGGPGYPWSYPPYVGCTPGVDCVVTPPGCTPGVDCPPPELACAIPDGTFTCDETTGTLTYTLDLGLDPAFIADTIKVTGVSPGMSLSKGTLIPLGAPTTPIDVTGLGGGQIMSIPLCIFDKAAMETGKPFDCCKTTVTALAPKKACVKTTAN